MRRSHDGLADRSPVADGLLGLLSAFALGRELLFVVKLAQHVHAAENSVLGLPRAEEPTFGLWSIKP